MLEKIGNTIPENNLEIDVKHKLGHYHFTLGMYSIETKRQEHIDLYIQIHALQHGLYF